MASIETDVHLTDQQESSNSLEERKRKALENLEKVKKEKEEYERKIREAERDQANLLDEKSKVSSDSQSLNMEVMKLQSETERLEELNNKLGLELEKYEKQIQEEIMRHAEKLAKVASENARLGQTLRHLIASTTPSLLDNDYRYQTEKKEKLNQIEMLKEAISKVEKELAELTREQEVEGMMNGSVDSSQPFIPMTNGNLNGAAAASGGNAK